MQAYKQIYVFADWRGVPSPNLMGTLNAQSIRGKEIFSFEYDKQWLKNNPAHLLDPHLSFFEGNQFLPDGKQNFGLFLDSSPDRWGRLLMRRREAIQAKQEKRTEKTLVESDFLLGVYDGHRLGGLRFKTDLNGDFMNNQKEMASPPWTSLKELEYASLQIEKENAVNSPHYAKWLNMLVDPGSSLGGARPKASVMDTKENLWIAKFPSANDEKDMGAWEMVLNKLAHRCGIHMPEARLIKLSGKHHTYLSKRFDRIKNQRLHFASAMTLLGYTDGADYSTGISYLELAGFIMQSSPNCTEDLEQLWRRIVFSILVSNTDDHLRNHGFILTANGWRLSPAYDINPNEYGHGLKLNITETSNEQSIELALDVAQYFKLSNTQAYDIASKMITILKTWKTLAKTTGISNSEIELVKHAFRLAV